MAVYLKLLLTALFWGGTSVAGRAITRDVGPLSVAFLRFALASSLLLILTWRAEKRLPLPSRNQILPLGLLGLIGVFAYNALFFNALKLIDAGRAAMIIALNPVFIGLLAAYFFKDRLSPIRLIGIVLSVTGAAVVISRGEATHLLGGGLGWGEILTLGCMASWVAYSLIGKGILKGMSPLVSVSYSSVVGTGALFLPAYTEGMMGHLAEYSIADWMGISYLGIFGTVLGFVWYYEGIKKIGPTRAGQFINFVPVSAIILAFFILGEPITWSLLVGGLFVISGVSLTNMKP
jgi:drug/metabolite transporter (DMT)-like permease